MLNIWNKLKNNFMLFTLILVYIGLLASRSSIGVVSVENTIYYLKEMLVIMPVIFVLTALLDSWVERDTIIKFLGKEAKLKGTLFAFVLGSISAGPIYAAFPVCIMLHKKGAALKNIVIILSSWAVIKIPMILNEVKFLGLEFTFTRWILTVIAILIFSWMTALFVSDEDIVTQEEFSEAGIALNNKTCMSCGLCVKHYPEAFAKEGKKILVNRKMHRIDLVKLENVIRVCPVKAIEYND